MLESNGNGDCMEVVCVEFGRTGVVCVDQAEFVGVVEAMDCGFDTMKEFWSLQDWSTMVENKKIRERERFLES